MLPENNSWTQYSQFLATVEILFQAQLMVRVLLSWYDGISEILNKNLSNKFDITITEYLTQPTIQIIESKFQT